MISYLHRPAGWITLLLLGLVVFYWPKQTTELPEVTLLQAPPEFEIPVAEQRPSERQAHRETWTDEYFWLKDPAYPEVKDPDVLAYLKAENSYFEQVMNRHQPLTERLFQEMKARLVQDDEGVPWQEGDYLYRWRYQTGSQYRIWERKPAAGGEYQLLIDEAAEAEKYQYFQLGDFEISPDGRYMAWSYDNDGSERFLIRITDLFEQVLLEDAIPTTSGGMEWAADSQTLFYTLVSEEWRPYLVRSHLLGQPLENDREIYREADPGLFVRVDKTQSGEFLLINSGDNESNEIYLIPADAPEQPPQLVKARQPEQQYHIDHAEQQFYIHTNDQHRNFRIAAIDRKGLISGDWPTLIAGSDQRYLHGMVAFKHFLAIEERIDGLDQVRIRPHSHSHAHSHTGEEHVIALPGSLYTVSLGTNEQYAPTALRLHYESMVTPDTVFDYQLAEQQLLTRKQKQIPSGYDASLYHTERLWATARDGVKVPISLVYRKDLRRQGQPLHLYGYGAYGYGLSPSFSTTRLSFLDRGFVFAIAHVRGGDELGYHWYEAGKHEKRNNTFNDFIDVANYLIQQGYAEAGNISISGRSAGGELVGAAVIQAPELWRAAALHVPFVDVLNTMLDGSLPLTPIEWPEWGNPITSRADFDLIRSYSPYDHIGGRDYPPQLITGGLNDPRVTYWEPAKWAARMRARKTDSHLLLLKTNMGAGHAGKSGRYDSLYEDAEELTFLLMAFGLAEEKAREETPGQEASEQDAGENGTTR